jgi:hypothetical protein
VELVRDLAIRFNRTFGQTFVVPELHRAKSADRVGDLQMPTTKMSKSDPDEAPGVLRMPEGPDVLRRKVMRAVTDSGTEEYRDAANKPGVTHLLGDPRRMHAHATRRCGVGLLIVRGPEAGHRRRCSGFFWSQCSSGVLPWWRTHSGWMSC